MDKRTYDTNLDNIKLMDVLDIELLQKFQDNFAVSMNIASVTVDTDGNPITKPSSYTRFCSDFIHSTEEGDKLCALSHKFGGKKAAKLGEPYIYTCHAGLIDFAAPILIEGKHMGTILGGQVLIRNNNKKTYIKKAKELNLNIPKFVKASKKIKITSSKNIRAAAEVLFIIANSLSKIGYEELKLKKLSKDLEIQVSEKDTLLKESKEYNRLKTQLFSTISHELKTPINIIYSAVQLLESFYDDCSMESANNTFVKYSGIMKQNCFRLIRLINNLIDMNKIELGFYSASLQNLNIVEKIEDIALSVVEYAHQKNIRLLFDTNVEEKIIAFDLEKMERIILNLLSNAIKFTESGGEILVNLYDKNNFVEISVKDTGAGIPDDMLQKIFYPFVQVDSSFRRNAEGSGIGLSLVKSLVEIQGGKIFVKSEINKGSEFIVQLPSKLVEDNSKNSINNDNNFEESDRKTKIEFSDIYL